jgi:hypothetical protein
VVAKEYKESAGEPLEKLVKKLSSSSSDLKDALEALFLPLPVFFAKRCKRAMKGTVHSVSTVPPLLSAP